MHGDVFDAIDRTRNELERPRFVSDAGIVSPVSQQLADAQGAHLDQRDYHLAIASGTRHHDVRPFEHKAGIPDLQQGQSGNGGGGGVGNGSGGGNKVPCADCKTPEEVAHCIKYGVCTSYQNGGGGGGSGGGGKITGGGGGGHVPGSGTGQKPGIGRGGGGLLGPGALGGLKFLPNVPFGAPGTTPASTGPSPMLIVGILAIVGVGGYFLWHKLRMARHQDKELDKGEEPKADAA